MKLFKEEKVRNAIFLGVLCSVSYLAVYIARNILGAVTSQLVENGIYTEKFIGSVSSTYFYFYAFGQLINGAIGDKIKARNMISFGLILAGVTNFLFPMLKSELSVRLVYGMTGFFLSMIYGPMTKVVAENTEPIHAVRCSLGYTFASFFGSPLAGVLASVMVWQSVFNFSSVILLAMGVLCFVIFILFEKHGIVKYGQYDRKKSERKEGAIRELFRRHIVVFTIVSIITGVIRTTVIFWLPTYLAQYLEFPTEQATSIYSLCTLLICASTFVAIFVYERLKSNMELTLLLFFVLSTASFLDFVSYMAAGTSSIIFANSVSTIGWGNLILVWAGLMLIGVITTLTFGPKRIFRKAETN